MRAVVRASALTLALAVELLLGAGLLPGCKKAPAEAADAGSTVPGLTADQAGQVLARVGDRTLTVGHFIAALQHMDSFDRMRYQSPERRKELLGEMIDVMLLADEARAQGYDKDPVTEQEIREILRDAMLRKAREGVPEPDEVPAGDVRAYYDAHRADFRDPERRRVSAIVLPSESAAAGVVEAARKGSAIQWGELVRSKSVDPQAKANVPADLAGDFGFVGPPGDPRGDNARVPAAVREAVFGMGAAPAGEVLGHAVREGDKFYVVKLAAKTEAHDRSLEEAERMIRVKLTQQSIHAKENAMLDALRVEFPVKVDDEALSHVKVDLPSPDGGR